MATMGADSTSIQTDFRDVFEDAMVEAKAKDRGFRGQGHKSLSSRCPLGPHPWQTYSPSQLAWSEGWQPLGVQCALNPVSSHIGLAANDSTRALSLIL